jgi:ABC-type Fe3+ transport system permease subunit
VEIPSSVSALLVAIFAVLPGLPGEKAYRLLVGVDWREDKWQRTLRLLAFSVAGFAVYAAASYYIGVPAPTYVSPSSLQRVDAAKTHQLGAALLGHMTASAIAGLFAGWLSRLISRVVARSAYSSAWDHFVNKCVKQHWVTVGLTTGESYLGYLDGRTCRLQPLSGI